MDNNRNYTVWFEVYGKKMVKKRILAKSEEDAKSQIKDSIIFHRTAIDKDDEFNDIVDTLDGLIDILGNKK